MKRFIFAVAIVLSGCATEFPACVWHTTEAVDMVIHCGKDAADPKFLGCQTGSSNCDLWVRKPGSVLDQASIDRIQKASTPDDVRRALAQPKVQ